MTSCEHYHLPGDVTNPWYLIQLTTGDFVVCHGDRDDALSRVCMISADGRHIVHSHGGQPGSDTGQYRSHSMLWYFCRAMLCISAAYAVMRCLSVCLYVCHVRKLCQNE